MRHFFKPPIFASEEQTQRAAMIHTIAWTMMIVTTLTIAMMAVVLPQNIVRAFVTVGSMNILGVIVLLLSRRGRTRAASILFVGGLLMLVAALAPTAGGIRAPAMTSSIIIVLMAGLLLGAGSESSQASSPQASDLGW